MSVLRAWLRSPLASRLPAGYRAGALVSRLRLDLHGLESQMLGPTCVRFRSSAPAVEFLAEEQVESQFLMHVVTTRFSCRIAGESSGHCPIRVRHTGNWKRTGIECATSADTSAGATVSAGAAAIAGAAASEASRQLAQRITHHPELASAMLPLDFTHCELLPVPGGWEARIVHFGASEVVYRLPPIRQYVRLSREQAHTLLQTFAVLKALI